MLDEKSKDEYRQVKTEIRDQTDYLWKDFFPTTTKYRDFFQDGEKMSREMEKSKELSIMLLKVSETAPESKMVRCLTEVVAYLTYVETMGDISANIILLLLAADGHQIHLQPDSKHWYVRHATNLKDLESPTLSLGTRIDFLDSHGCEFFSKWIKTDLRNKIAHSDFYIDNDGNFFIVKEQKDGTETKVPFDISKEFSRFRMYGMAFITLFSEQIAKISH